MIKAQSIREPYDTVQFKMYLIPDFSAEKSVIVQKFHHNFADGLGVASFLLMLADKYDAAYLPTLKPVDFMTKALIKLMWPYIWFKANLEMVMNPNEYNNVRRGTQMSGNKNGSIILDMPQRKMKDCAK
jgi:hypothetical protein